MPARKPTWTSTQSAAARKILAATLPAPCVICGHEVHSDQPWDAEHLIPRVMSGDDHELVNDPSNWGVAHSRCNRIKGARLGNQLRRARKARKDRYSSV